MTCPDEPLTDACYCAEIRLVTDLKYDVLIPVGFVVFSPNGLFVSRILEHIGNEEIDASLAFFKEKLSAWVADGFMGETITTPRGWNVLSGCLVHRIRSSTARALACDATKDKMAAAARVLVESTVRVEDLKKYLELGK